MNLLYQSISPKRMLDHKNSHHCDPRSFLSMDCLHTFILYLYFKSAGQFNEYYGEISLPALCSLYYMIWQSLSAFPKRLKASSSKDCGQAILNRIKRTKSCGFIPLLTNWSTLNKSFPVQIRSVLKIWSQGQSFRKIKNHKFRLRSKKAFLRWRLQFYSNAFSFSIPINVLRIDSALPKK